MQLKTLLLTTAAAISASAAPTANSVAADVPQWTIVSFTRTCDSNDTSCAYSYSIDTHTATATPCSYNITKNSDKPASQTDYNSIKCGVYTISSGWSGQFGPGNGFQTLAVTDGKLIAYPAYADKELVNGAAVQPDRSYPAQNLPAL